MSSEVEEIKDRLGVVELIGEYIRVSKAGSNWKALCPFHNEKTPSFMLSEERRSWHCFGCGKGGDIFSFVMEMEGLGFREALEMLAQKAGVELKRTMINDQGPANNEKKAETHKILELATKWYEKNLWEGKGKEKILKYLHERGLTDKTIKIFRIGYAPDGWRNLLDFLQKKNFSIEDIARTGLLVEKNTEPEIPNTNSYDRFRDRVMFPIQDIIGRVIGFSARIAPGGDEKSAKYINTPQTGLYDKSKVLYGIHLAKTEIKKQDAAILVEGNMDVVASHQAGFQNTIAVSGTALTNEQIRIIKRYTDNVVMAFDMDAAGQAAVKRSAKICLENDLNVKIVLLTSGKDAADVLKEDKKAWVQALAGARKVIDYFFEDAFMGQDSGDPVEKKKIASILLNIIKDIASPIEKAHWVGVLAQKLGIDDKILFEILKKTKPENGFEKKEKGAISNQQPKENYLEKRILGLLIAFPREIKIKNSSLEALDFSGSREKLIFERISQSKDWVAEGLKETLQDYDLEKIAEEAAFELEVEAKNSKEALFDPAEEFEKTVERIQQGKLREKIAKIARDMETAEKSGDKGVVSALMREFQKLSEKLSV